MKIPLSVSLLTLVVIGLLLTYISRQDDTASEGRSEYGYVAFNHGTPAHSNVIMKYWRNGHIQPVKNIIVADYILMIIYCLYLCVRINYFRKNKTAHYPRLKKILSLGLMAVLIGTATDALQDYRIYRYLVSEETVGDMRYYTWTKFIFLGLGILSLLIALAPRTSWKDVLLRVVRFVSVFLKSIWLFFPGILFLLLPIFCFWLLGQGKDIIVAFIDNPSRSTNGFTGDNFFRLLFFVAIGFWVYVSWYSSRIIAYIKAAEELKIMQKALVLKAPENIKDDGKTADKAFANDNDYFEISKKFLHAAPRIIGNSCFLILELAVLQSPILMYPIRTNEAWGFFFIFLLISLFIDRFVGVKQGLRARQKKGATVPTMFDRRFKIILFSFLLIVLFTSFFKLQFIEDSPTGALWMLFVLLVFFHAVFIYYVNLRRSEIGLNPNTPVVSGNGKKTLMDKTMHHFNIPTEEKGYYRWFLILCTAGLASYLLAIFNFHFARLLTPFPLILLGFAALLIFGNSGTAVSVRHRINVHFLIFLAVLIFGSKESHEVRTKAVITDNPHVITDSPYNDRPDLKKYLSAWLKHVQFGADSSYDVYFVMANGGASRSGYWTAAVLGTLEDSSIKKNPKDRFSDHLFCLSGTSGGDLGLSTFFSLLNKKDTAPRPWYAASCMNFLRQDYFSYTIARLLGPDYFRYIFPFKIDDRAAALEESLELSSQKSATSYAIPFEQLFSSFPAMTGSAIHLPLLFINTTRMQDGNPGVVTNLDINPKKPGVDTVQMFNRRVDVVGLLPKGQDFTIATASILGARFPYLSPAGAIANNYFVDGGYFDNSGAGVVQELIRGIIKIAKDDTTGDLLKKIQHLNFKVLHIVNSPVINVPDSLKFNAVAPIKNDLLSPVLTIVGAYDMQTTVNDVRLINYINDLKRPGPDCINATYTRISLYEDDQEWQADTTLRCRFPKEPAYALNWFMSDSTAKRITMRLKNNPALHSLLQ